MSVIGNINGNDKELIGRVLFDNGSQTTLVKDEFAETMDICWYRYK